MMMMKMTSSSKILKSVPQADVYGYDTSLKFSIISHVGFMRDSLKPDQYMRLLVFLTSLLIPTLQCFFTFFEIYIYFRAADH